MVRVNNAVIMAAGTSSRFAPLSYEKPKALIRVKGEILIERQIRQLQAAGIYDIYIVTGYKAEQFGYLKTKFGVHLRYNQDYAIRNNTSSIKAVEDILENTYICSADNYFSKNIFETTVSGGYYAAVFSNGPTKEWCLETDTDGFINQVTIGGNHTWYMLGQAFWDVDFSNKFLSILNEVYDKKETANKLWEDIYIEHLDELKLKIRKYPADTIYEFDTLDELRQFDSSYNNHTGSKILANIAKKMRVCEGNIKNISCLKGKDNQAIGFSFKIYENGYRYLYDRGQIEVSE